MTLASSLLPDPASRVASIARACKQVGRAPQDVCVIAVSKEQPADRIDAALAAGQRHFGENRVRDAIARWQSRRIHYPDLVLHLIGPLQTNKVRDAVAFFDCIHTLDRPSLLTALGAEMDRQQRYLPCFIQVNTGNEPQKAGIDPDALTTFVHSVRETPVPLVGLMTIPPIDDPAGLHFALLATWARRLGLPQLSMGMSDDYETAIACGATHIRIGSAFFGARPG